MYTVRNRYDLIQKYYFKNLYEQYGQIPDNHMQAMRLRIDFFKKYVLDRNPTEYETNVEKDWTFIARREYRWNVTIRALSDGFAMGNVACVIRMFMIKKFVIWPLLPVMAVGYLYRQHDLLLFYNKKYFDMLNVGVQYEIGAARNKVLAECNRLLDTEDF